MACSTHRVGGSPRMSDYRVYCLDASGHFIGTETIEAGDDGEALVIARSVKRDVDCELWRGSRFIARLPAPDQMAHSEDDSAMKTQSHDA